jgi:predicted metal-dependent hydrolase
MHTSIELGDITLSVRRRDIKHVHLSVYPPNGKVTVAAPMHMSLDKIRLFAIAKLAWIKAQQKTLREQERETKRELIDRESHYVWGERCLLAVTEANAPPSVELRHAKLLLRVRPGTDDAMREAIVAQWYRQQVKDAAQRLIAIWQPRLGVSVRTLYVQHMRTKWGSCTPAARNIRLNTELAKKPPECLEYIVLHEMVHLLERTHGPRFVALMDQLMPQWRRTRKLLNRLPARHEQWTY